jgi:FixJ family two-component response regulator
VDGEIDLLVTDVLMPVADGPTLAAHLLELKPNLPVLFVSGFSAELSSLGGGCARLLQKPFLPQALLDEVVQLLESQAARALTWEQLCARSGEIARRCVRLALKYEGLDEHAEEGIRRSRKLLGQE